MIQQQNILGNIKDILTADAKFGVVASIYFASESSQLDNADIETVKQVCSQLKSEAMNNQLVGYNIELITSGYADERGPEEYNIKLSHERSENVSLELAKNINMLIETTAFGEAYSNAVSSAKKVIKTKQAEERRVDIYAYAYRRCVSFTTEEETIIKNRVKEITEIISNHVEYENVIFSLWSPSKFSIKMYEWAVSPMKPHDATDMNIYENLFWTIAKMTKLGETVIRVGVVFVASLSVDFGSMLYDYGRLFTGTLPYGAKLTKQEIRTLELNLVELDRLMSEKMQCKIGRGVSYKGLLAQ